MRRKKLLLFCFNTVLGSFKKIFVSRNANLSFFYFLCCLQNTKKNFWCHHIAYKCFFGDIRRSIKLPKTFSGGLLSCQKHFQEVYEEIVSNKVEIKQCLKISKIKKKIKFIANSTGRIRIIAHRPGHRLEHRSSPSTMQILIFLKFCFSSSEL